MMDETRASLIAAQWAQRWDREGMLEYAASRCATELDVASATWIYAIETTGFVTGGSPLEILGAVVKAANAQWPAGSR